MNSALVAGGAGFIGSHLVKKLLDESYEVIAIDSLITGFEKNISELLAHPNFRFIQGDISQEMILDITNLDFIFHLASPASPPKYFKYPHETIKANVHGTMNLLDLSRRFNARMIFASTSEIYGDPEISPQNESYWGNVNPIGPRSVYDESKRLGETLCAQAARDGLNIGIVRIFNTYGPKMDPFDGRVVSTFLRQALTGENFSVYGSGNQTRSFCYVDDLVEGLIKFSEIRSNGPINLGNPNEISVINLAEIINYLMNTKNQINFLDEMVDDPQQRRPEINLAKQMINWSPKIDLETGLRQTADWMKANF